MLATSSHGAARPHYHQEDSAGASYYSRTSNSAHGRFARVQQRRLFMPLRDQLTRQLSTPPQAAPPRVVSVTVEFEQEDLSLLKMPENKEMKVVFEEDVEIAFDKFFELCLADSSNVPGLYAAEREEYNVQLGAWRESTREDGVRVLRRDLEFDAKMKGALAFLTGLKSSRTVKEHACTIRDSDIIYEETSMALDVPYGKNFKVQTLFHISPSTLTLPNGKQQTHVKALVSVFFINKVRLLGGKISKESANTMEGASQQWVDCCKRAATQ